MLFKDAIMQANKMNVIEHLEKDEKVRPEDLDKYIAVFEHLKTKPPIHSDDDITVAIDWGEPEFDGEEGYYRVHGYQPGESMFWGIEYSSWGKWLGWKADERFIMMNGVDKYVALCLWEMTWGGFTEKDVEGKVGLIFERDGNG